ncbi:hypothetical protein BH11BAC5_BH11BAC5_22740 [soil metagenome]
MCNTLYLLHDALACVFVQVCNCYTRVGAWAVSCNIAIDFCTGYPLQVLRNRCRGLQPPPGLLRPFHSYPASLQQLFFKGALLCYAPGMLCPLNCIAKRTWSQYVAINIATLSQINIILLLNNPLNA